VSYRKLQFLVWGVLGLIVAFIITGYVRNEVLTKSDLPILGEIKAFTLTNQLGQTVTLDHLKGKVWVADIVFTRCAGPCPKMTEQMALLQKEFSGEPALRLVTLTTDPEFDTPKVLQRYGEKFKADSNQWSFLTGTKPQIKQLAVDSLKLTALDKPSDEQESSVDLFIHSTVFMLVDKHGRLRGHTYESLEPGFHNQVAADIRKLLRER
jgi:protein SCO1/2